MCPGGPGITPTNPTSLRRHCNASSPPSPLEARLSPTNWCPTPATILQTPASILQPPFNALSAPSPLAARLSPQEAVYAKSGSAGLVADAWGMHRHQVDHASCCGPGYYKSCQDSSCQPDFYVGDTWCDHPLSCYCEEATAPACMPGQGSLCWGWPDSPPSCASIPPVPTSLDPVAPCPRCQHPHGEEHIISFTSWLPCCVDPK